MYVRVCKHWPNLAQTDSIFVVVIMGVAMQRNWEFQNSGRTDKNADPHTDGTVYRVSPKLKCKLIKISNKLSTLLFH